MAAPTTPSSLHALFVFNPDLGEEATEARKLLYFYDNRPDSVSKRTVGGQPDYVDLNYEKDMCGIAEGLIAFTRDFAPETLCESVHCQQNRYAFFQPEPNYWMVLVVKNPTLITKESGSGSNPGGLHTEYLDDELDDNVLQAIIHRCYSLFSLFNSSFEHIVSQTNHDGLRGKLQLFMTYFLPTIRFSQLIYFTDIHGFQFLPVDKITFLTIQYIINLLTLNFSSGSGSQQAANALHQLTGSSGQIKNCALMYCNKLIYSGFNSEIMFLLYSLDQDLMYWFLNEYLTLKENLHLDMMKYMNAYNAVPKAAAENAWSARRPQHIPGMYNIPESVYERNGRLAINRKEFEKAQNKGIVSNDVEFEPVDSDENSSHSLSEDDGVLLDKDVGIGAGSNNASRSSSGAGVNNGAAPFGFITGPFRANTAAPPAAGSHSSATLPGTPIVSSQPCINSPQVFLDSIGTSNNKKDKNAGSKDRYGSGNPGIDATNPSFHIFPNSQVVAPESGAPATARAQPPLRLVVYQKYKITLFLVVEDEVEEQKKSTEVSASSPISEETKSGSDSSPESSPSPLASNLKLAQQNASLTTNEAARAAKAQSLAASSTDIYSTPQPPVGFYSALEGYMESNLKKLAEMLSEQSARLNAQQAEEPYRFLYFNHMNLALKTSLSSGGNASSNSGSGSSSGGSSKGSGGTMLTMETIKLIRELHQDFNTPSFKQAKIASSLPVAPVQPKASHSAHSIREEGATEVCVKTKNNGWVVGRRATQSHREFFLLLEDKFTNLTEIQEEVDNLARTYFYNIYIH